MVYLFNYDEFNLTPEELSASSNNGLCSGTVTWKTNISYYNNSWHRCSQPMCFTFLSLGGLPYLNYLSLDGIIYKLVFPACLINISIFFNQYLWSIMCIMYDTKCSSCDDWSTTITIRHITYSLGIWLRTHCPI